MGGAASPCTATITEFTKGARVAGTIECAPLDPSVLNLDNPLGDTVAVAQSSLDKPGGPAFACAVIETFYEVNKLMANPATRDDTLVVEVSEQGTFALRAPGAVVARQLVNSAPETLRRALAEAADVLTPLWWLLKGQVLVANIVNTDDTPVPVQDSSMIAALAKADCMLIREAFAPAAKAGDRCAILRLTPGL